MTNDQPLSGCRVLIVEDDYMIAADARDWLEKAGAAVIGPTPDPVEACKMINDAAVDIAVLDINLGQGPAFEVAHHLVQSSVPFIFATGYDPEVIPAQFEGRPRLQKPFRAQDLIAAIKALT